MLHRYASGYRRPDPPAPPLQCPPMPFDEEEGVAPAVIRTPVVAAAATIQTPPVPVEPIRTPAPSLLTPGTPAAQSRPATPLSTPVPHVRPGPTTPSRRHIPLPRETPLYIGVPVKNGTPSDSCTPVDAFIELPAETKPHGPHRRNTSSVASTVSYHEVSVIAPVSLQHSSFAPADRHAPHVMQAHAAVRESKSTQTKNTCDAAVGTEDIVAHSRRPSHTAPPPAAVLATPRSIPHTLPSSGAPSHVNFPFGVSQAPSRSASELAEEEDVLLVEAEAYFERPVVEAIHRAVVHRASSQGEHSNDAVLAWRWRGETRAPGVSLSPARSDAPSQLASGTETPPRAHHQQQLRHRPSVQAPIAYFSPQSPSPVTPSVEAPPPRDAHAIPPAPVTLAGLEALIRRFP